MPLPVYCVPSGSVPASATPVASQVWPPSPERKMRCESASSDVFVAMKTSSRTILDSSAFGVSTMRK